MNTIRLPAIAIGLAVVSEMKAGKNRTAVGCPERREKGDYMLTSSRGGSSRPLLKFSGGSSGLV